MTLLFCDGFDHYTTVSQKWDSTNGSPTIGSGTGRFGNGLGMGDTNHGVIKQFTANQSWVLGIAFRVMSSGSVNVIRLDSGSTEQIHVEQTAGKFHVYCGATLIVTGTTIFSSGTWVYVELKVTLNTSGGTAELHLNGTLEGSSFTGNTANAGGTTADALRIAWANSGGVGFAWDDLYVCNQSGSTNNDYLGDVRVESIFPNGNGNSSVLVGSDSNSTDNYLLVDETAPNSDTDYVESLTVGDKDTYAYTNVTATSGTIKGLQIIPFSRKTDAGTRSIVSVARHSVTEVDSANKALSASYIYQPDIRETKPGGGAWSISDVNGAEFGVKVSA